MYIQLQGSLGGGYAFFYQDEDRLQKAEEVALRLPKTELERGDLASQFREVLEEDYYEVND